MSARSRFSEKSGASRPGSMTLGLLIAIAAGFVLGWIPELGENLRTWMVFNPVRILPWTPITYPFIGDGNGNGLFFFVLGLLWWFWVGNGLEPVTGKWGLLINFLAAAFLEALMAFLAVIAGLKGTSLMGAFLPVSFMTIAFCARSPESQMNLYGVIPVKFKWFGLLTFLIVIFGYGTGEPALGLMMALPLILAWLYGAGKLPVTLARASIDTHVAKVKENKEFDEFMTKVKTKEKDREERERLRKLFEDSMADNDE